MPKSALKLRRTVVLVGMMGAGKSAIGRTLAARLGVELKDSDAEIEARSQLTIAEIFEREGEAFFREKEAQVIASLLDGPPAVLSTGGGAWLSPANRRHISARAAVLWLKADADLLWQRVRHKTTRPLLRVPDPRARLEALLAERTPAYEEAEYRVEVRAGWSIDKTTDAVIARLIEGGEIEEAAA